MFSLERPHAIFAFWAGCLLVTVGALLHLPMFLMARESGYVLAGMPMDLGMAIGMALILVGIVLAGYGLLPLKRVATSVLVVRPSEDAPLNLAHVMLMVVLVTALVVDVMKPASLGFVVPGMAAEYGLTRSVAAWLPFSALTGTYVGSIIWGILADIYGRRASILLSTIMFVGTSICGAMPSFWWNVGMCFMMGAAAGGLLPVVYALLAETMPARHRGWSLVMVGGLGAAGGYLAASASSAFFQPLFGWRIMWFLNIPTGLLLVALSNFIPESPKFLVQIGQVDGARALLSRFGAGLIDAPVSRNSGSGPARATPGRLSWVTVVTLSVAALAWSLMNFGVLLWLPAHLVAKGQSIEATSRLLAGSALLAMPASLVAALLYSRWSAKNTLLTGMLVTTGGLVGMTLIDGAFLGHHLSPVLLVAVLIIGSNTLLAVLLPYTAELFPAAVRARALGWVSGCTKCGGIFAQGLGLLGRAPTITIFAAFVAFLLVIAGGLVWFFGAETRGRKLEDLEVDPRTGPIGNGAVRPSR